MAVFKCKMCGGALEINNNETVVTCGYCGTQQTLPKIDDEKKLALFNRANNLRLKSEFDKSAGIYESIIAEFPEEAEAYWGLVLCKYGIEYVDDKDGSKIPTCHRTLPTSIMKDEDFQQACENADISAKNVYREEAKAIDGIQKKILEIASTEEPYDIFICYKETDDVTGARTEDSSIAQDIYTALTEMGYKVFYARNSLRKVAGAEYEPYIYAALSSAKVMLAIGTKYEYYDAVWVKNEWSRFISMIASNPSKVLIPCFKNMDAYDIPEEFSNMQALDMADMMFFNSLEASVKRVMPSENKSTAVEVSSVNTGATATVDSLLKRAFMFLGDGEWTSAKEYCEKVLDIEPENAQAYLGKLMAEVNVKTKDGLSNCTQPFDNNTNYQKIIRYGDVKLVKDLKSIANQIKDNIELARKDSIYIKARESMNTVSTEKAYKDIAKDFESLGDFKDSLSLQKECLEKAEILIINAKEKERIEKEKKSKGKKRKLIVLFSIIFVCVFSILGSILSTGIKKQKAYNEAVELYEKGEYVLSGQALFEYRNADFSSKKKEKISEMKQTYYEEAQKCYKSSDYYNSAILFGCAGDYNDAWDMCISTWRKVRQNQYLISASNNHSIGLMNDGKVVSTTYLGPNIDGESNEGQTNVEGWGNISAIVASNYCSFGLNKNGNVASAGSYSNDVSDWENIVEINAYYNGVAGLKEDGTVVASGTTVEGVDVSGWKNMIYAIPGCSCLLGVDYDGNVLLAPGNDFDNGRYGDYQKLKDIVMVSADFWNIYALRADGMVLELSNASELVLVLGDISSIYATSIEEIGYDIIAIDSHDHDTIALYNDGHVGSLRANMFESIETENFDDIIAVSIGEGYIIGLKRDGTVVSSGENNSGATCVQDWKLY